MPHPRFLSSISEIPPGQWNELFASANPFVQHAFLEALENSGSVSAAAGWQPLHLLLIDGGDPVAALPLYLKSHSYGEFVFDWSWAEAYRRQGLDYYPKLLSAIPFSPVAGPRIGLGRGIETAAALETMLDAIEGLARQLSCSGWHLLFADGTSQRLLAEAGEHARLLRREDVQFHWFNRDFASFEDFLSILRSSRRKNLRRERRRVAEQGVELRRHTGGDIRAGDWRDFYTCYCSTYLRRSGHGGYLTRDFFDLLLDVMRDRLLLVTATRDDRVVGSSLFLFDDQRLYGRYWGALEDVHCLHFEACFYQGIEFCIERGLAVFDPGTQGEHKLMRGFEPVRTVSFHWLSDPRFGRALADYLARERTGIERYEALATDFLPFRKNP